MAERIDPPPVPWRSTVLPALLTVLAVVVAVGGSVTLTALAPGPIGVGAPVGPPARPATSPVVDPVLGPAPGIGPGAPSVPVTGAAPDGRADRAIAFALAQRGIPYVWGGDGPAEGGFDCSGLTRAAYAIAEVALPRVAQDQFDAGPHVTDPLAPAPGDLVFYGTPTAVHHVGLYLGGGLMVQAPHPGTVVQVSRYRWTGDDYVGATRPAAPGHDVGTGDLAVAPSSEGADVPGTADPAPEGPAVSVPEPAIGGRGIAGLLVPAAPVPVPVPSPRGTAGTPADPVLRPGAPTTGSGVAPAGAGGPVATTPRGTTTPPLVPVVPGIPVVPGVPVVPGGPPVPATPTAPSTVTVPAVPAVPAPIPAGSVLVTPGTTAGVPLVVLLGPGGPCLAPPATVDRVVGGVLLHPCPTY